MNLIINVIVSAVKVTSDALCYSEERVVKLVALIYRQIF